MVSIWGGHSLPFSWVGVYFSSAVLTGSVQGLLEAFLLGLAACLGPGDLT